jgi:hypothetical protein
MQDSVPRKDTNVLSHGGYDRPDEKVEPGVPAALPPPPCRRPKQPPRVRAWLVRRNNPVNGAGAVNGFWRMYFGSAW